MRHIPLDQLLMYQTMIVQELGLYLSDGRYSPRPRDFVLLSDIQHRAQDTHTVCRYLEVEFWKRKRWE
jgi:hypothetical protein